MIDYSIFHSINAYYTIKQRIYEQSYQLLFREMRDLDRRKKSSKKMINSNIRREISHVNYQKKIETIVSRYFLWKIAYE